jgi:Kef-type K+ transport system membrane component KefB
MESKLTYTEHASTGKGWRNAAFYVITIAGFSALIYWVLKKGALIRPVTTAVPPTVVSSATSQTAHTLAHNITQPLAILLLQIITIILVARALSLLFKKLGQPAVIGEILAGMLLGPSVLGHLWPHFSAQLFPAASMGNLQFLSQIGLILFMFVVGMELDAGVLRNKAGDAVVISHASIIFPFTLGVTLAYFIYNSFAPAQVGFTAFALFIGISMSITAFPVLARIIQEKGLAKTRLGAMSITCAAADDITAWCMLAVVIAIIKAGSIVSALYTIGLSVGFVLLMLYLVRPFLEKLGNRFTSKEQFGKAAVALFVIVLLLSAAATEIIGIHALFGAFLAGVIMPSNAQFRSMLVDKIEDLALVLLLPLFFVFTGLRTQIGLLNDWHLWKICALIIGVAVTGKFLGTALAARFTGQNWPNSLALGALMNTRGLMELIVLNIGYDLGVLSPSVFAMMVIMALVTTAMTGPALQFIERWLPSPESDIAKAGGTPVKRSGILAFFSHRAAAPSLLQLAEKLVNRNKSITMMHVLPSNELNQFSQETYEQESFAGIEAVAANAAVPVLTMFKASSDISGEVVRAANQGSFDWLIAETGRSAFEGSLLGRLFGFTTKILQPEQWMDTITGKENLFDTGVFDEETRAIVKNTRIPLAIYLGEASINFNELQIPILAESDSFLLETVATLLRSGNTRLWIPENITGLNDGCRKSLQSLLSSFPNSIYKSDELPIAAKGHERAPLIMLSLTSWEQMMRNNPSWLAEQHSVLIVREAKA